jgi:hypothetical protein
MERATVEAFASADDRREYHTWVRRIAVMYGLLLAGGVIFAVIHHPSGDSAAPAAAVVADYHAKR